MEHTTHPLSPLEQLRPDRQHLRLQVPLLLRRKAVLLLHRHLRLQPVLMIIHSIMQVIHRAVMITLHIINNIQGKDTFCLHGITILLSCI